MAPDRRGRDESETAGDGEAGAGGGGAFVFDGEGGPRPDPPGTADRLREDIRPFFADRRMDYGLGALGGSRHCYGHVSAPDPGTADELRRSLADWLRGLRFRGVV